MQQAHRCKVNLPGRRQSRERRRIAPCCAAARHVHPAYRMAPPAAARRKVRAREDAQRKCIRKAPSAGVARSRITHAPGLKEK